MKLFGLTFGTLGATIATAIPALAQDASPSSGGLFGGIGDLLGGLLNPFLPSTPSTAVPEIDASSGLLAIAALLAALAFAWERKRRA